MKFLSMIALLIAMMSCSETYEEPMAKASLSKSLGMVSCQLEGYDHYTFDVWSVSETGKATKLTEVDVTADEAGYGHLTISSSHGLIITGDQGHDLRAEVSSTTFQEHPFSSVGEKTLYGGVLIWSAFTSDVTYKTSEDVPFGAISIYEVEDLSLTHKAPSVAITLQ